MRTALDLTDLTPGFADPTRDSQVTFRALMEAMARPGRAATLDALTQTPAGLSRAASAALLTLADQDTPVWLDPTLLDGPVASWLRFHCSCPLTQAPQEAAFALIADGQALPDLGAFHQGDAHYPDRAVTILVQVTSLTGGAAVMLEGPGIPGAAQIAPTGLDPRFWPVRAELVAPFQFGLDCMLCADRTVICLPRTTRATPQEG